jgi:mRNA interferase MazF
MVAPAVGQVVLIPFPFSDLSESKLRPAVVLADAGRGDWILCQVTSRPYGDTSSIEIADSDFATGALRVVSYVRPGKLFTASKSLFEAEAGRLSAPALERVREAVIALLRQSI